MTIFHRIRRYLANRRAAKAAKAHAALLSAHTAREDALANLSERTRRKDTRGQHRAYQSARSATHEALRQEVLMIKGVM